MSPNLYLPPETKLGQGNMFRSVCQEFCPRGGSPGPHPGSRLGDLQAHTGGGEVGGLAGGYPGLHLGGGAPGPHLGGFQAQAPGGVSQHALRQTPQADGYCCGWNASYWNAFL